MFIQYNGNNVHALPYLTYRPKKLTNKRTGKSTTVMKLDTNQAPQDIKWLRPGWNEFPKAIWEQNKDHPQIQHMLKKKLIVLMAEKVAIIKGGKKMTKLVGPEDEKVRLRWFETARAVEIVKGTYDREMLQRWEDEETRHRVKKAIKKQLEPLMASPEDKDEDDDQDEMADEE